MVGDASYEFDRWLAAHDREVAEKAWGEGFMRANRLVNCRMCRGTTVPKINPYTVWTCGRTNHTFVSNVCTKMRCVYAKKRRE